MRIPDLRRQQQQPPSLSYDEENDWESADEETKFDPCDFRPFQLQFVYSAKKGSYDHVWLMPVEIRAEFVLENSPERVLDEFKFELRDAILEFVREQSLQNRDKFEISVVFMKRAYRTKK